MKFRILLKNNGRYVIQTSNWGIFWKERQWLRSEYSTPQEARDAINLYVKQKKAEAVRDWSDKISKVVEVLNAEI